jgi:hypothetical protein
MSHYGATHFTVKSYNDINILTLQEEVDVSRVLKSSNERDKGIQETWVVNKQTKTQQNINMLTIFDIY